MFLYKIFCLSPLCIVEPYNLTSSSASYRSSQWTLTGTLKSTPPTFLLNITKFSSFLTTGLNWPCYLLKIQMALSITAIFFQIWIPRITLSSICLAFLSVIYTDIFQEPLMEQLSNSSVCGTKEMLSHPC